MKKKGFSFSLMLGTGVLLLGTAGLSACSSEAFVASQLVLNKNSLTLSVGETATLKASVSKGYEGATLYWTSTNENVALVKKGNVIAVGVGECEIHADYAGGHAVCKVTVLGEGGGGGETQPYLRVSPTNKTISVGGSFRITYTAYPENTTVQFESDNTTVATVDSDGFVSAVSAGEATIRVTGSNEKVANCAVTVTTSGGGEETEYSIGVDSNLQASGSFVIGSPTVYKEMTISLLKDFNKYTNSNITWEIKDFEEATAAQNLTPDAALGPDVFPYASDQTQGLNTLNALTRLGKTDKNWISTDMGPDALNAATLGSIGTVGYPFASDNSYVMFYDKSQVSDISEIDTFPKLFAKAASLTDGRKTFKVSLDLGNGFYGAAALMSYTGGQSLYKYIPNSDGSYKSKSTFDTDEGLAGARAIVNLIQNNQNTLDSSFAYPTTSTRTLATITDCSKVLQMKQTMGDNYACSPLPFIDDTKTTRLSNFSGYKFYGVNNKKLGNNTAKKEVANAIAKFLVSEYAQHVRLETFGIKPTMKSLQEDAKKEPHVDALNQQAEANASIALSVVDSTFWSQTGNAVVDIKTLAQAGAVSDAQLKNILSGLDAALLHNWDLDD